MYAHKNLINILVGIFFTTWAGTTFVMYKRLIVQLTVPAINRKILIWAEPTANRCLGANLGYCLYSGDQNEAPSSTQEILHRL